MMELGSSCLGRGIKVDRGYERKSGSLVTNYLPSFCTQAPETDSRRIWTTTDPQFQSSPLVGQGGSTGIWKGYRIVFRRAPPCQKKLPEGTPLPGLATHMLY